MMANPATSPEQDSLALAERAEALLAQGQVDAAQQTAREAATRWQDNETAWRIYARASFARSDHAEAFAAFSQAVKLTADPRDLLGPMGKTALVLEEHAAAENLLAMAVEAGVGGEDAIVDLAWSQIGQTAFDRARDTLRRALEADPQRPSAHRISPRVSHRRGRCGSASRALLSVSRARSKAVWPICDQARSTIASSPPTPASTAMARRFSAAACSSSTRAVLPIGARRSRGSAVSLTAWL